MSGRRVDDLSKTQSAESGSASPTTGRSESSSSSTQSQHIKDMNDDSYIAAGSKTPSPSESIDFRFLNFAHPKDAKNAQTRRSVRSHVTARQHQNTRRVLAAELAQRSQASSSSSAARELTASQQSPGASETETSSPEAISPSPSPTSERPPPVRINSLEVYPEEWHSSLRPVMDHYVNTMCVDIPEIDSRSRDQIRTHFLAIVFTDAASLHALLLTAAAHYSKLRGAQAHGINILQLKGMAIQEVNRALMDRSPGGRATSDQMIAAVGKMATYEMMFGERETFHTHMTGLQRIISLRGGLQALGLSGLLERILLWIDANAAVILGCPLYFPPAAFSSSVGHPQADQRLFLLGLHGR